MVVDFILIIFVTSIIDTVDIIVKKKIFKWRFQFSMYVPYMLNSRKERNQEKYIYISIIEQS